MDDRWEAEVTHYGAINITGFRIVDTNRPVVKQFLDEWANFDVTPQNPKRLAISVSIFFTFTVNQCKKNFKYFLLSNF